MRIIALHGQAGAGKDTFADELVAKHGFVKRGFADPLYEEVAAAFGVTVDWLRDRTRKEAPQPELALLHCQSDEFVNFMAERMEYCDLSGARSPRWILQQWGTEYRRAQDLNYWLDRMTVFCFAAHDAEVNGVVIPDCRFDNEAEWVLEHGGRVVEIVRPGPAAYAGTHASAKPLDPERIFARVHNREGVSALRAFAAGFLLLLPACTTPPDIERSYRECLLLDRPASYTVSKDMAKMECPR